MASIRSRLTTAYAAALAGTIAVFAGALYVARRASVYQDLETRVEAEADQAVRIIGEARESGEPLTVVRDSLIGPTVTQRLRIALEGVADYVVVLDTTGRTLYNSFAVRQLDPDDQVQLTRIGLGLRLGQVADVHRVGDEGLLLLARRLPGDPSAVGRVIAGVSTHAVAVQPRELMGTFLVVAPFVLVLSIGVFYAVTPRAFRPVDRLIDEIQAITDGRSLHRRLSVEGAGDELQRLAITVNDMIGRLETSFSGLRRFTADASHELKTPLTVLRADVERAMTAPSGSNEQLAALEEAIAEVARMADLVDSLLTLARADEGRFDLHREPVPLLPLAREVLETAIILGEEAGLNVSMPIAEDAVVMGDRTRLRQLFLNLVTNAIKYTSRGGKVELTLSKRLDGIAFSVKDSGIGIAAADLPFIFERFWRADRARSRTSERGGFGLGLAISQYIAQAHGGMLTVQSRLGRGTIFTVTLPEADAAPDEALAEEAAAVVRRG